MQEDEFESFWASLNMVQTAALISRIMYEITISARGTYEAGTREVLNGSELRLWNEQLHQMASFCFDTLRGEKRDYIRELMVSRYCYAQNNSEETICAELAKNFDRAIIDLKRLGVIGAG